MKTTTASVFLLLIIFSIAQSSYLFVVAGAPKDPVLDVDGKELRTGVHYYVVSRIRGTGGGLALGRSSKGPCPEKIIQRRAETDDGIPVIFSNADANVSVVHLYTDVNINFVPIRAKLRSTTTVWKLGKFDYTAGKWWLTTGGVKGHPGPNTMTSWFKIEKGDDIGYKFQYCPTVCKKSCETFCNIIGLDEDADGQRRMALSIDQGWPFQFKKAGKKS